MYLSLYKERDYEELAHMIMEAERSHNLPSTSWSPRKLVFQFQSYSEGLRTRGAKSVSPSLMSQLREMFQSGREREFSLPPPFCSIQGLSGLDDAPLRYWGGPSALLSLLIQTLISSRNILTKHTQK